MPEHWDAIVIGTGGVGSAALLHLARRGLRVVGLDPFPAAHDRGSSHGQTRVIRQAYFEHPDYVPLLRAAYRLWDELQQEAGRQLFFRTGLLEVGPPDGVVIPGVLRSAALHQLEVDRLTHAEVRQRCPGFHVPESMQAVFEHQAGYLLVEQCVLACLQWAQRLGARHHTGDKVLSWSPEGHDYVVRTTAGEWRGRHLVVTAGPWAAEMLPDLPLGLQVRRKHLHWYASDDPRYLAERGAPVFFFETMGGFFYGFPQIDQRGVKVAEHSGGEAIEDPLADLRHRDPRDQQRIEQFLAHHLPGVSDRSTAHDVCYYTVTPDEHFVVDRHPTLPRVAIAAGLSGHGFKFASVLGQIVAELAIDGTSSQPMEFLRIGRLMR